MHEIDGLLHDGRTSGSRPARLAVYADGTALLSWEDGREILPVGALQIPSRLGNTPRRIGLPDGSQFETSDNAAVDAIQDVHGPSGGGWLHWLESHISIVVGATAIALVAGGLFAVYGIPLVAREAAFAMTPELNASVGRGALEILEQNLEPSELDEERKADLTGHFERIVAASEERSDHDFELLLRGGGGFGANAFALPSGTVLMTDELVRLAEHDEELIGVLAHEVGHVVHRHGLRQAIQSSMLAIAIVLVTGDVSSTTGFVAALPALLAEQHFSRDFEHEADDYARAYLASADIDPERLAKMLQRLEREAGENALDVPWLSSHPPTRERAQRLRQEGLEEP